MSAAPASFRLRVAVWLAAAVVLLSGLGRIDASAPDEPRYLQVAEELRSFEHGAQGLVLLHLNGEPYTQKPPLYYWAAALFGAPLGRVTEGAARLPSALAGIFLVALTLRFGSRLLGGTAGVLGAALLLSLFEFVHLSRRIQLDVVLAALEMVALVAFWWIDRDLAPRRRSAALLHGAMGLAVLTKGPVGFLVPTLVMVAYLALEGRLRDLRRAFPWWGLLLSVAPGLVWIGAATTLAPSGFAEEAVGTNLIGRFFAGTSHERPIYYYLYQFPVDFLPWTFLLPVVFWAARRRVFGDATTPEETRRAWRFLLAWLGASLVFFTISSGKRGLYLLPAFPAAALLCADATARWLAGRAAPPRSLTVGAAAFAALAFAVGAEGILAGAGAPLFLREARAEALRGPLLIAFGCALIGVAAAGVVAWVVFRRNRAAALSFVGVLVATVLGVELAVFTLLYPALDPITSLRPIATAAGSLTPPDERIGLWSDEAMIGGLVYYGGRRVAPFDTPEGVRRFVAEGGRAIVVKRRKLDRVQEAVPVEIRASSRTGSRELVVVTPTEPAGGARAPSD